MNKIIEKLGEWLDLNDEKPSSEPIVEPAKDITPTNQEVVKQEQTDPNQPTGETKPEDNAPSELEQLKNLVADINNRLTNVEAGLQKQSTEQTQMQSAINILKDIPTGKPLVKTEPTSKGLDKSPKTDEDKLQQFASFLNAARK